MLTGSRAEDIHFLPRIQMTVLERNLPKPHSRFQFPVRSAYALTTNKSQRQTFKKVGICLQRPCFSHGQLYVAFSRATKLSNVGVYVKNSTKQGSFTLPARFVYTRNVVYHTILDREDHDQLASFEGRPPAWH